MSDETYTYDVNEFDAAGRLVARHRYVSSPGGSPIYAGTGSPSVAGPIARWLHEMRNDETATWAEVGGVVSVNVHFVRDVEVQEDFVPLAIRQDENDIGYIAVGPEGEAVTEVTPSLSDLLDKKPSVGQPPSA